jgi:hypothetical protein
VEPFVRRPTLTGLLLALPVAAAAAWFAVEVLGPNDEFGTDLGAIRGAAYAIGALVAGGLLAARVAREDLGPFSALGAFAVVAQGVALVVALAGDVVGGAFAEDGAAAVFVLSAFVSLGASLLLWVPAGVLWVAALRRLTIPGLRASTEEELAASEAARDAAAREHVRFDATNVGAQGSKLRRNRT